MSQVLSNVSSSASITSAAAFNLPINVGSAYRYSFQCNYSGASSATITLQGSNDNANWVTIGTPVTVSSSSATTSLIGDAVPNYQWANLHVAVVTGTMALSVIQHLRSDTVASN